MAELNHLFSPLQMTQIQRGIEEMSENRKVHHAFCLIGGVFDKGMYPQVDVIRLQLNRQERERGEK